MWLTTLLKFSVMHCVIVFISKIISFSVIYLGIFLVTPDAFRFSSDYNIAPLSSYWSTFYDTDDPSSIAMNGVPDDLESFRVQAVALEKAYTAWQARETERRSAEEAYYAIMQELSAEADRNTEEYKDRNIAPLEREVAIIQQKIADVSLSPDEKINLLEISQRLNGGDCEALRFHYQKSNKLHFRSAACEGGGSSCRTFTRFSGCYRSAQYISLRTKHLS